ncbi:hypothetical protein Tco_0836823 [Tanacetum coccineum]
MIRSTVKRLTKPLDEPKREFRRLRRAALQSHQNESLAIAGRNLFDEEASSSNNIGPKSPTASKTLHEHSHPTPSNFQNPITFPTKQTGRIVDSRDIRLIQTDGATRDTSRLRFFHYSLKRNTAEWLDRIPPLKSRRGISSFHDSSTIFPVGRTSALKDLILRFKQGGDEPIKSVWVPFLGLNQTSPPSWNTEMDSGINLL